MEIGRKIYYDKNTGVVVQHIPEASGPWIIETSREKDFIDFPSLSERNPDTVGLLQLEYGQYAEDFAETSGFRVNPDTLSLEFAYPDPNNPEQPPIYQPPLTAQVAELKAETAALNLAIIDVWETLAGGGV